MTALGFWIALPVLTQTVIFDFDTDVATLAASWKAARRIVAKVKFQAGELFPRVGFIVTNLETDVREEVRFYNKRGHLPLEQRRRCAYRTAIITPDCVTAPPT